MINLHESMGPGRDRTHGPLDLQSDSHLLPDTLRTALRGPVSAIIVIWTFDNISKLNISSKFIPWIRKKESAHWKSYEALSGSVYGLKAEKIAPKKHKFSIQGFYGVKYQKKENVYSALVF